MRTDNALMAIDAIKSLSDVELQYVVSMLSSDYEQGVKASTIGAIAYLYTVAPDVVAKRKGTAREQALKY